ncbi:hypothetical protein Ocin01_16154 [Orchesella cincta]|uniref:Uncharacterized protein n=1 Tax=Orchesella cincta TaxID=48709 RepID=A0A1D2MC65_ORCCI|nr:hypothetical protein Ocin01_16154 [Orchesella cincta]
MSMFNSIAHRHRRIHLVNSTLMNESMQVIRLLKLTTCIVTLKRYMTAADTKVNSKMPRVLTSNTASSFITVNINQGRAGAISTQTLSCSNDVDFDFTVYH